MEMKGLVSKKPVFGIGFRADYTDEERAAINQYNLGGELLHKTERLTITIKSLKDGHYIECPDLEHLLKQEEELRTVCEGLKNYLRLAKSFDGREEVVEF
jgi:hypothetical protein